MDNQKLSGKSKLSYALGAVGKDMVYMLSASYIMYYYEDLLKVDPIVMSGIIMAARVFDAFNDPIMGTIVAKTKTRWGKFRPWLLIGTLTNAVILYLMFAAPPKLDAAGLAAYAAVFYILWGVTYTIMDIPYWSMIPAFTQGGKERENLTALARTAAGVGAAIVTVATMKAVPWLGGLFKPEAGAQGIEIEGFKWFSLIVGVIFIVFIGLTCLNVKEKSTAEMKTASVKEMFKALLRNDQAMTVTIAIVLVNCAIYITSNLVIYFFKYDFGTTGWNDAYVLFNTFGGAVQVLAMMLFYPLLRKKFSNRTIFDICLGMAILGYLVLLGLAFTDMTSVFLLFIPGFCIFAANGMLTVITTIFLANTVDYGELKNGRRDESVIFSMQTFVVKLASGIAILAAGVCLKLNKLSDEKITEEAKHVDWSLGVSQAAKTGLRMTMTVIPILGLIIAFLWFRKKFILNDQKVEEISAEVKKLHEASL